MNPTIVYRGATWYVLEQTANGYLAINPETGKTRFVMSEDAR